jgi:hypothetical protein
VGSTVTLRRGVVLFGIASAVAVLAVLPARRVTLSVPPGLTPGVRGVMHVHTRDSDGTGTVDEVAAAAARAGLAFVVVTDHGDATRPVAAPVYRSGVLCIDATEVSTFGGHVIALGIPMAPYPLAGAPRDVVDDIHRLGGMAIVAHPHSGKADLRWSDFDAPFDGLEWLNADSEWRDEQALALARVLATYGFRGPEALATMLDRTSDTLRLWDSMAMRRRVVAVPGTDAHAKLGDDSLYLRLPSYEALFETFSVSVTGIALTGRADTDASAVIEAIRRGHVYSTIDGLASPGALQFSASNAHASAQAGDAIETDGTSVTFRVQSNAPASADVALWRDGKRIAGGTGASFEHTVAEALGAYRIEIALAGVAGTPPVPWIVSNPIYVVPPRGTAPTAAPASRTPLVRATPVYLDGPADAWAVEKSDRASGAISVIGAVSGTQLLLRYALGGSKNDGGFVAFVTRLRGGLADADRLTFSGRASRPMRAWVQLRAPTVGGVERRWRSSVYLDEEAREIVVPLSAMTPVGATPATVARDAIDSLLLVIDQVNTRLGSSGQVWIDDVRYER